MSIVETGIRWKPGAIAVVVVLVAINIAVSACSSKRTESRATHMMQVEVVGTREQLRALTGPEGVQGVEIMRRIDALDDGKFRGYGLVVGDAALQSLRGRGLEVTIVVDAETYEAEMQRARDIMNAAYDAEDGGTDGPNS